MTNMTPDEARLEMTHELHRAIYGDSWARPETPKQVWEELLDKVRTAQEVIEAAWAVSEAWRDRDDLYWKDMKAAEYILRERLQAYSGSRQHQVTRGDT